MTGGHLEQMASVGTDHQFVGFHFADPRSAQLEKGSTRHKMLAKLLAHPEARRELGVALRLARGAATE